MCCLCLGLLCVCLWVCGCYFDCLLGVLLGFALRCLLLSLQFGEFCGFVALVLLGLYVWYFVYVGWGGS